jgi:hypothetical protein
MSNEAKSFKIKYEIEFKGTSRKFPEDRETAMEKMIDTTIMAAVVSLGKFYKTLEINFKKNNADSKITS